MNAFIELFPTAASTLAPEIDNLYFLLIAISGFFTVLIVALILFFSAKYRAGNREADRSPMKVPMIAIEAVWIGIPLVIVLFIFVISTRLYTRIYSPPPDNLEIFVTGKQWMWKLQHPSGKREINTLHVPVNQPVKLTMISQDVIHSFYVPAFRVKQDVLPGRYSSLWFEATKTGTFHLFCAEYCGTDHSGMVGEIVVMKPEDYERWVSGISGEGGSLADQGEKLFTQYACHTCHSADAVARGPLLDGLYGTEVALDTGKTVTADEDYLRESIYYPARKIVRGYAPLMPTFKGQISEDGVLALIAYIKALGEDGPQ